ncbi:MAG: helix-turn-helix transcriptional regulator [Oscillospiraceae bacterium]|nr:helix-turn-helix transcriptional regulator [Oscillospiraceae bacterium]
MNVMKKMRLLGNVPSQGEVAKALGVQQSAVSKWEVGLAKPRADKLPAIAKLYGCTIEELLADCADTCVHENE